MNLNLITCVYSIFDKVKESTGKDIQFIEKTDLGGYASVKIARENMPSHFMYYKPEHPEIINHLISHECGHILRMYGVSSDARLTPYTNDQIKLKALSQIEQQINNIAGMVPFDTLARLINIWYTGTIRQITNYPSDIMIEKWIYDDYPDLRPFQLQSLKKQYDEAVQGLSHKVEKMTPRKFLEASNSMNYAFFKILGDHLKDSYFFRLYDRSYYSDVGKKLIVSQQDAANNYRGDIETVNNWAKILNISNWFDWRDFENIPDNYLNSFS